MHIYLPIAETSVIIFVPLGLGALVGFFSGLFGVGGGFLITPLLIFYNIPPAIAVGSGANQVIASSAQGAFDHFKRRTLDIKLGLILSLAGLLGSFCGIYIFSFLRRLGQLDLIISLLYVGLLGIVGLLMAQESIKAVLRAGKGLPAMVKRPGRHNFLQKLPWKMRFQSSGLYISLLPVIGLGFIIGILSSIMGVGGGFILVPAMIYLLHVPTNIVVGTSLFQVSFVASFTTIMQAVTNHSVDIVLAVLLMIGGIVGVASGNRLGRRLKAEQLRLLMALLILMIALWLAFGLFIRPAELVTLVTLPGG